MLSFCFCNVPHKLKVLTEGESLFNDATALIIFSIALVALNKPEEVTASFITIKTLSVVFGAVAIGVVFGFIATIALKLSKEPLVEGSIILLFVYAAFLVAEHFHFSGILAVIVAVVMSNKVVQQIISNEKADIVLANKSGNFGLLKHAITTKDNQEVILKSLDFVAMFAAAALFVSVATIVNFDKLFSYGYEIMAVFIASTVIRGLMMLKFAFVSNNVEKMQIINRRWWGVLTFAGSKGALSILMVHMIPNSFQYKELFENIIIGNILLSTFVYALILAIILKRHKDKFEEELALETHH